MSKETAKGEKISNTNTPYDDVFKTLLLDCRNLIVPVVNEIFDEDYTREAIVQFKENEVILRKPGAVEDRFTDSSFSITEREESRNYHLECQSTPDGSMIVRMYEYDSQIALKDGELEQGVLRVNFPQSAVLYLRYNESTPDVLRIYINTPGGSVSYDIPIMKIGNYSVDLIFDKKLYFLIPFYIFVYSRELGKNKKIGEDSDLLIDIRKTYIDIMGRLEKCCDEGEINEYTKCTICEMSETVVNHLASKHEYVMKEVSEIMGGKVLEYHTKKIYLEGIAEGEIRTHITYYLRGKSNLKEVMEDTGLSERDILKMAEEIRKAEPELFMQES